MGDPQKHARLSASAAARWLACPGSVAASEGMPRHETIHSASGTYAHSIAAECMATRRNPETWLGNKTIIDGFAVECDQEMVDAVQVYLDHVAELRERFPKAEVWVEMPLLEALQTIDQDFGGTADFVLFDEASGTLIVVDFKYGAGVYVEVIENKQLAVYVIGVMRTVKRQIKNIESVVVQPRFDGALPIRSVAFSPLDVMDYVADLQEGAAVTRLVDAPRKAGDHCKFCPAAGVCPELKKQRTELMAMRFDTLPESVDLGQVAKALQMAPMVRAQLKALDELAYALAVRGVGIPGHKLVAKQARRRYKDDAEILEWAKAKGVDPYSEPELLSPAQLEKRIAETLPKGKKKKAAGLLAPLVESVSSGTVLVPESDSRPPAERPVITGASFEVIDAPTEPKRITSVAEMF